VAADSQNFARWIDNSGDVMDFATFKTANNLDDRVNLTNVAQKLIAQTLSLACSLNEAGDINEFDRSRYDAVGF